MVYKPALDGIRALAVLSVIAFHTGVPGLEGGFLGVDVFFVLSGFLITGLLVDEQRAHGRIRFGRFFGRRLLRLTPALLLMLAVYLLVAPLVWTHLSRAEHLRDALVSALYLSDYGRAFWQVPDVLRHTWSLSVEEHFYLTWPFVLAFVVLPLGPHRRIRALFGLYVALTLWRYGSYYGGDRWAEVYYRFDMRLSGLVLGAWLALVLHHGHTLREPGAVGLASAAALAILCGTVAWKSPVGLTLAVTATEFATAGLILAAMSADDTPVRRLLAAPPLPTIGVLSYGLYLWHYPMAHALKGLLPWYSVLAIVLPLSFLCAAVSLATVERAGRRLRGLLFDDAPSARAGQQKARDEVPGQALL